MASLAVERKKAISHDDALNLEEGGERGAGRALAEEKKESDDACFAEGEGSTFSDRKEARTIS